MLKDVQLKTIADSSLELKHLTPEQIEQIANVTDCGLLSDDQLVEFLQIANLLYRSGNPLISDHLYDSVFLAELQSRNPEHPFLHEVEPEPVFAEKTIQLPERMLSTEKAYTKESIEKWLARIEKAAQEIHIDYSGLIFIATPKLDGYAAYDDGNILYTRGDGRKGTDISRVFERGLIVAGNNQRGQGAGEIVVNRQYFQTHLADVFENTRNFQASIIKEKDLDQHALKAIQQKAAVFFPFSQLPRWQGSADQILENFDDIVAQVLNLVDFDVDGVVFEVTEELLKQHMGATRHPWLRS